MALDTKDRLIIRRTLAGICYFLMLAADAAIIYVIHLSVNGGITYYFGQLVFVPVFIVSYWMSTFFAQLSYGKVSEKRIFPKWLRSSLNWLSTLISVAFLIFWGYIYVSQMANTPVNETQPDSGFMSVIGNMFGNE